jgi:hypothetical protein
MIDPFEQTGNAQIVSPRKAQLRATATRAERKRQKALAERHELHIAWKKWYAENREALFDGEWGKPAQELMAFLESMTLQDAPKLIEQVTQGPWQHADAETKFQILSMVDFAIVHLRESAGMVPFDDALDNEPPTVFQIIRELLQ